MWLSRSVGVNLHPTSLPGGRLGPEAYAFVDWLAAAGARFWQVLPLNPPDDSALRTPPCRRSRAGPACSPTRTPSSSRPRSGDSSGQHAYWIGDWVAFAGGDALADQVRFQREWSALRAYAAERDVRLIGDVPIYVAAGSCDHAAHPELFLPDGYVAGAPPDPLNELGQKWGNPLYDWDALSREDYRWWTERLRRMLGLFDAFRIDHFRGFVDYWAVPTRETAREGHWSRGPGAALFLAAERELGTLPVIVEDLGHDHAGRSRAARRARLPGHGDPALGLRGAGGQPAPAREPSRASGRLHLDPRHRHARRDVPGRAGVAARRAGAVVPRSARDGARPGRARARLGVAHEPARRDRRQLELAARAGPARPGRGSPAAVGGGGIGRA